MTEIKTKSNIGRRILAGMIDYTIIYGFTFFLVFTIGEPNDEGGYSLNGLPALIPVFFWFFMTVGLEYGLGGTVGNSIAGLKVIPLDGNVRKLTFGESLLRRLLDPIDTIFSFGLVAFLLILNTKRHQRLGDLWAETIVVRVKDLKNQSNTK